MIEFFKHNKDNKELLKMQIDQRDPDEKRIELAKFVSDPESQIAYFKDELFNPMLYGEDREIPETIKYIEEMLVLLRSSNIATIADTELAILQKAEEDSEDAERARYKLYSRLGISKPDVLAWLDAEGERYGSVLSEEGKQVFALKRRLVEETYGKQ